MNVLYTRVSTKSQTNDRQIKEGFDLVLPDVISGSVPLKERPYGKKLIDLIENGRVETITVHAIDRLGRNLQEILANIEYFNSRLVCLVSEREGIRTLNADKTPNAVAKLLVAVLGSIAEMERERILERAQEGRDKGKKLGNFLGRKEGSKESPETFMAKEINQKILRLLKRGHTLRMTALKLEVSTNLVIKVRNMNQVEIDLACAKKNNPS
jgi:DNA invertase Pin-like site-specific DNA recombinase